MNKLMTLAAVISFAVVANVNAADKTPVKSDRELRAEARNGGKPVNFVQLGTKKGEFVAQGNKRTVLGKDAVARGVADNGYFARAKNAVVENPKTAIAASVGTVAAAVIVADLCRGKNSKIRSLFGKKQAAVVVAAK